MIGNIETLDAIRSHCVRGAPLPIELRGWLAEALRRYLEQDCENLNEAFGIIQARGGVPWRRERAIRARDTALRELYRRFLGDASIGERARLVAQLSRRYAMTCWPRDCARKAMPDQYRGTPKEYLWRAFKSRAKMPVTERHLRSVLGD